MDFAYSETQKMIAETVRDFGAQHIKPYVMDWDDNQEFPVHVFKALGELGVGFDGYFSSRRIRWFWFNL